MQPWQSRSTHGQWEYLSFTLRRGTPPLSVLCRNHDPHPHVQNCCDVGLRRKDVRSANMQDFQTSSKRKSKSRILNNAFVFTAGWIERHNYLNTDNDRHIWIRSWQLLFFKFRCEHRRHIKHRRICVGKYSVGKIQDIKNLRRYTFLCYLYFSNASKCWRFELK